MEQPNNNQKANRLCCISLACVILPAVLTVLLPSVWDAFIVSKQDGSLVLDILRNIFSVVGCLSFITGIATLIYVRVKYPQNRFGKVLMWIYIVITVIMIIALIVLMIMCHYMIVTCGESCGSCLSECRSIDS